MSREISSSAEVQIVCNDCGQTFTAKVGSMSADNGRCSSCFDKWLRGIQGDKAPKKLQDPPNDYDPNEDPDTLPDRRA